MSEEKSLTELLATVLGGSVLAVALLGSAITWQAFVLWHVWNWGAPAPFGPLTYGQAIALDVLIVCVTPKPPQEDAAKREGWEAWRRIAYRQYAIPGLILAIAWIVQRVTHG